MLERTLFSQTKQDRTRIFEEILFFKATKNTKTNESLTFLSLMGFLQKEMERRKKTSFCKIPASDRKITIHIVFVLFVALKKTIASKIRNLSCFV